MKTVLDLEKLTKAEKLRAMEELWQDLSEPDEEFESPAWHGEVLKERESRLREGKDEFIPWEDAKRELNKRRKE